MIFWEYFVRLLPRKPLPALGALYWHLSRRRLRALNRVRAASASLSFAYEMWIKRIERNEEAASALCAARPSWRFQPLFSVLLYSPEDCDAARIERSTRSVEWQLYPSWNIIHTRMDAIGAAIADVDGDYVVPLLAGDMLSEVALLRFAEALQSEADASILYGDEDELDERGRVRPWFKPGWNAEMFLAQDYLSRASAIVAHVARSAAETSDGSITELVLAATSLANGNIVHVPHVLVHADPSARISDEEERLKAVGRHVHPYGGSCEAGPFGTVKIKWPLPAALPLVSIIIPTKDKVELLKACTETLIQRTDYAPFEILIVDNASVEQETAYFLAELAKHPEVRVLSYPGRYNFSAINNFAAKHARGTFLCLLNNDTEVLTPEWLSEMMRYAVRTDVGAVGAKLLYDDRTIQHAGVIIGIGGAAGHAHRSLRANDPGYFRQAHIAQFVSAVTAACLVVDKAKYEQVGGLDEQWLAVAFNDVDLCLKLEKAGWRNVYVPHAELIHHESKSRGNDISPRNIDRYRRELSVLQDRWGTKGYSDPLHNPNLDRANEAFVIRL